MKKSCFVMTALLLAFTVILVTACGNTTNGNPQTPPPLTVADAPAFPDNAIPLTDASQVQAVLDEIKASGVMEIIRADARNVRDEYEEPDSWYDDYEIKDEEGDYVTFYRKNDYNESSSVADIVQIRELLSHIMNHFIDNDGYDWPSLNLEAGDYFNEKTAVEQRTRVQKTTSGTNPPNAVTLVAGSFASINDSSNMNIKVLTPGLAKTVHINAGLVTAEGLYYFPQRFSKIVYTLPINLTSVNFAAFQGKVGNLFHHGLLSGSNPAAPDCGHRRWLITYSAPETACPRSALQSVMTHRKGHCPCREFLEQHSRQGQCPFCGVLRNKKCSLGTLSLG